MLVIRYIICQNKLCKWNEVNSTLVSATHFLKVEINHVVVWLLSRVRLFCDPLDCPARLLCPWGFPGRNTGMGCHFLLQGIFLSQGLNLSLLHWQADSLPLSHQGSPVCALGNSNCQNFYVMGKIILGLKRVAFPYLQDYFCW